MKIFMYVFLLRKREVDIGLLTHSPLLKSSVVSKRGKLPNHLSQHGCEWRIQQSLVEVYARFMMDLDVGRRYFFGKKVHLRVTDLVRRHLRVLDPEIASLKGAVVQGHMAGRTEVQVRKL